MNRVYKAGRKIAIVILLGLLSGCQKYYLSVRQIPYSNASLASTKVDTPDPRQKKEHIGQKLFIDWMVPPEIALQNPMIRLELLYKNHEKKTLLYPIHYRTGYYLYSLVNEEYQKTGGLLTYKADIVLASGAIYKEWKHQLWVQLIVLEEESSEEASRTSSAVDSQSKHGSVIDTPNRGDEENG